MKELEEILDKIRDSYNFDALIDEGKYELFFTKLLQNDDVIVYRSEQFCDKVMLFVAGQNNNHCDVYVKSTGRVIHTCFQTFANLVPLEVPEKYQIPKDYETFGLYKQIKC